MIRPALTLALLLPALAAPARAQTAAQIREAGARVADAISRQQAQAERDRAESNRHAFYQRLAEDSARSVRGGASTGRSIDRSKYEDPMDRAETLDANLLAITARGVRPARLTTPSDRVASVPRLTPLRLTLVSPDGGVLEPLIVSVRFIAQDGNDVVVEQELVGDTDAIYRLDLPALPAGRYRLRLTTVPVNFPVERRHVSEQEVVVWE